MLAFFSIQAIFAGGGLNTASRLLSRLIARHHPAIKRLFAKGARTIGGVLKIAEPECRTDFWRVLVSDDVEKCHGTGDFPSKPLPLPVVPATQEILGLGNVSVRFSQWFLIDSPEV
jgi:hypothetical protein